jgi:lambda family phage tail tape measure protein
MEDSLVSFATTGKADFKGLANSIIADIVRIQVRAAIAQASGSGGFFDSLLSAAGSFFGSGGVGVGTNNTGTSLPTAGGRAIGGPVSAGSMYQVTENGPELLKVGGKQYLMMGSQGGTVAPSGGGGGSGNTSSGSGDSSGASSRPVTVNVTNNGNAVQARSSQRETSEGTVIDIVLDAVAHDMQSGGRVHDATQRRFGLNPGGSTPRY